jgi:hypothetical protein
MGNQLLSIIVSTEINGGVKLGCLESSCGDSNSLFLEAFEKEVSQLETPGMMG